jgi:Lrp/AsnC family transcriptional regulator, leucine-responsive regulatory protein
LPLIRHLGYIRRMTFDKIDRDILRALQQDGRLPNSELAERVGLSQSACFRRLQRLEDAGVIEGYTAVLSARAIGRPTTVFIEVTLASQRDSALDDFERAVRACPDILECQLMSGDADYLLRVAVADTQDYERVHRNHIAAFPHVARIRSMFALRTVHQRRGYEF